MNEVKVRGYSWTALAFHYMLGQWTHFNQLDVNGGGLVKFDETTESRKTFSSERIQIDTCFFEVIHEWIHITIDISGFDVFVKELRGEGYGSECFSEMDFGVGSSGR
ncbi:hypothetical protein AHAS_Ahas02G0199600 [Arachis hypogaea]